MNDPHAQTPVLHVLIVDDEPLARHWLRVLLGKMPMSLEVAEAASAALATQWLQQNTCHVILLDIHMPGTDGLTFAKECQELSPDVAIIFVTADSSHALQAFELHAFDYLTKPVSEERLEQALNKVCARLPLMASQNATPKEEPLITIENQQSIVKIPLSTILCFHSDSKYTEVITKEKTHLTETSLNHLESQLEGYVVRTHRSYLVPLHAIEGLAQKINSDAWELTLQETEQKIPVSRRQLPIVKDALKQA